MVESVSNWESTRVMVHDYPLYTWPITEMHATYFLFFSLFFKCFFFCTVKYRHVHTRSFARSLTRCCKWTGFNCNIFRFIWLQQAYNATAVIRQMRHLVLASSSRSTLTSDDNNSSSDRELEDSQNSQHQQPARPKPVTSNGRKAL